MMQIQKETLKCSIHKNYDIQFANISNRNAPSFQCQICLLKTQLKEIFVSIPEIIQSNDDVPIQNWPFGIHQSMIDFLVDQGIENKKQIIQDKINEFYKELKSQILQIIDDSQLEQFKILDKAQIEQYEIMDFYNKNFKRQELKSIFTDYNQYNQQKYQELLSEIEETKNDYLDELNKKIQHNKNIENYISFDYCQQIKRITSNLLSQINFFPEDSLYFKSQINDQIKIENNQEQEDSYIVQQVNQIFGNLKQFKDVQQILQLNIQNISELYQIDQQDIAQLTSQLMKKNELINCNLNQQLNDFIKKVEKEILPIKEIMPMNEQPQLDKDNYILIKNILGQKNSEKLFRKYKSLTTEQIEVLNESGLNLNQQLSKDFIEDFLFFLENQNINTQNHQWNLNLFQSKLCEDLNLNIQKQQIQRWKILNKIQNINGELYSEEIFAFNKSYIIRFKLNYPIYKCQKLWIGLIRNDQINQKTYRDQYLCYSAGGQEQMVKKGKLFKLADNKDEIFEIEMRVRLDKGIVQFSDFPNYKNILQNRQQIDVTQQYRLGICFQEFVGKELIIDYCQEQQEWVPFI